MGNDFVPDDLDASKWENLEPLTRDLLDRKLSCSGCLENLISDSSKLAEHVSETGALLYIGMTCDTESEEKKGSFLEFVSNVRPKLSEFSDSLNRRIVNHPSVDDLPERYDLMLRGMRNDIEIFRKENIPLGVRQTELVTEAQSINGAMTVDFHGEEMTFPQMSKFLESNDRSERQAAWTTMAGRRMEDNERLSEIFDELISIRHQIALNAGFESYTQYMFRAMHRFDYTIEDCLEFHDSVESLVKVCDVVTINCPLHPETENLFDDKLISKMKKGAYIVNTARGKICNREAIAKALKSGQLSGYAGDVWFPQPAPNDHIWRSMPNHGMTPVSYTHLTLPTKA